MHLIFRGVIGYGDASFVDDPIEKRKALDAIMRHYELTSLTYPEDMLVRTVVLKVKIQSMTGKKSGN